jgi:HEPN domain-containing protein
MKRPLVNAARWLRQAQFDLRQAERMLEEEVFSYAAFFAEQSAQKALKAFLLSRGRRRVMTHSVGELAAQAADLNPRFSALIGAAGRLDRHYLTSRYPDALPEPAIPAEVYVLQDAEEAVRIAGAIVDTAAAAIPQG